MGRPKHTRAALIAVLVAAGSPAFGDDEVTITVPETVVTATRTEERAEEVTTSLSVISGKEIDRRGQDHVSGALRAIPGVDVVEFGSPGRSAFLSIRGAAPDQVLVQIDGVEVNSTTVGLFDFSDLTTDGVDRIEVLRGGGGALYGSEAIGGVVDVITARGRGPFSIGASAEGGNGATHREHLTVAGTRGPFSLSGAASSFESDGFRPINDHTRNVAVSGRADADLAPGGTLTTIFRYTGSRTGLPFFNVAEGRLDPDARSHRDFMLAKGEWVHAIGERLTYRASVSFVRDSLRFRDDARDPDEPEEVEPVVIARLPSEILGAGGQVDYGVGEVSLTTIGIDVKERSADVFELEREGGRGRPDAEQGAEDGAELESERFAANRTNVGVYGQEQLELLDRRLHAAGGIRYDRYDEFGDQITFSGSAAYLLNSTGTILRTSYAEGFRAPTFEELFDPGIGNPGLQAEESWEVDVGLTQRLWGGRVEVTPALFYRRVDDLIEEVADLLPGPIAPVRSRAEGGGQENELARNLDARFRGVELETRIELLPGAALSGTYTYLEFDTPSGTLLNRPHHRGSVAASGARGGVFATDDELDGALALYVVGDRDSPDPLDGFEAEELDGYVRADLSLAYRLPGRLAPIRLTASVHNLFDADYEESIGFAAAPARFLFGIRGEI
jgi:vitamin B12 transporter